MTIQIETYSMCTAAMWEKRMVMQQLRMCLEQSVFKCFAKGMLGYQYVNNPAYAIRGVNTYTVRV